MLRNVFTVWHLEEDAKILLPKKYRCFHLTPLINVQPALMVSRSPSLFNKVLALTHGVIGLNMEFQSCRGYLQVMSGK